MLRMKNWFIGQSGTDYTAPELRRPILIGNIFGHDDPDFPDGTECKTPIIKGMRQEDGYKVVIAGKHEFTVYAKDVLEDYEKEFPNAYERLNIQ